MINEVMFCNNYVRNTNNVFKTILPLQRNITLFDIFVIQYVIRIYICYTVFNNDSILVENLVEKRFEELFCFAVYNNIVHCTLQTSLAQKLRITNFEPEKCKTDLDSATEVNTNKLEALKVDVFV